MMTGRRYPVGIQTFSRVIREGYIYVDKTDLVWQLAHYATYVFMSRPRRFGKSLLTSTLESYFKGERELFEGLKIMELEREWEQYPVIRLDLSMAKSQEDADALRRALLFQVRPHCERYGIDVQELTPGQCLTSIIQQAYQQTGKQVVIIVDEYDAPLLEVLHEEENLPKFRKVMQEFYGPLKACEAMVKFCFITGITKFSQLSIFSTINNLKNVSLRPEFSAICGITEQEVKTDFAEDIRNMALKQECTPEEMFLKIKNMYDGYHFAAVSEDIYNPFSLLNAFDDGELTKSWFASGTPTYLIHQMQHFRTDIASLERMEEPAESFDVPTEAMTTALPLLYQSGYLTIKGYDRESEMYTLAIPNQEVRLGYTRGLLPTYIGLESGNVQKGFALKFWRALKKDDVELAMQEMKAYLASVSLTPDPSPKGEGSSYIHSDNQTKSLSTPLAPWRGVGGEALYLIFSMLNVYVRTQVKCAGGRTDMVVWMPDTTYVFELKTNATAQEALEQIDTKGYAIPYQTEDRRVVKIGVRFDVNTRTPEEWVVCSS